MQINASHRVHRVSLRNANQFPRAVASFVGQLHHRQRETRIEESEFENFLRAKQGSKRLQIVTERHGNHREPQGPT